MTDPYVKFHQKKDQTKDNKNMTKTPIDNAKTSKPVKSSRSNIHTLNDYKTKPRQSTRKPISASNNHQSTDDKSTDDNSSESPFEMFFKMLEAKIKEEQQLLGQSSVESLSPVEIPPLQEQKQEQGHLLGNRYSTVNISINIADCIAEISQKELNSDRRTRNNKIRELQDFVKKNCDLAKRDYDSYKYFHPEAVANNDPAYVELGEICAKCERELSMVKTAVDCIRREDVKQ